MKTFKQYRFAWKTRKLGRKIRSGKIRRGRSDIDFRPLDNTDSAAPGAHVGTTFKGTLTMRVKPAGHSEWIEIDPKIGYISPNVKDSNG